MNSNEQMSSQSFRQMLGLPPAGKTEILKGKAPKLMNKAKEKIALGQLIHRYAEGWGATVIPEYRFHDVRAWRLDWYIPELRVGIEFQGLSLGHSKDDKTGHSTAVGRTKDCEKANQCQIAGIVLLQYTALDNQWQQFATDIVKLAGRFKKI